MKDLKFAAFVITYERPLQVVETIKILLAQEYSPSLILIVDNSISNKTEKAVKQLNFHKVQHLKVGYNSGPAGGAKIGLLELTNLGFDWIYWGDDDDPPRDSTVFKHLFKGIYNLTKKGIPLGIFGGKGALFNTFTGRVTSLSNSQLRKSAYVEVDFVAGGQTLLVNSQVVQKNILPEEKLFFGFEDLDFCIKVKKAGYKIYTDSQSWLNVRERDNFKNDAYRWKGNSFGKKEFLQREFYSTRSLLHIFYKNGYFIAFLILLIKSLVKMFAGFRYGREYGAKMFKIQKKALTSFFSNNYGLRWTK